MSLTIDVLVNDGSPVGVTCADIEGSSHRIGLGGAELALLTMCEAWHKRGDKVTLYNSPAIKNGSPFEQRDMGEYNKDDKRDVVIVFRSPNGKVVGGQGKIVWWSCDQYTQSDFKAWSRHVNEIVTISPEHNEYFESYYGIHGSKVIDIPVRDWEYEQAVEKTKNKLIFCSVPDRGLAYMLPLFHDIKRKVPDATLTITSDYRLWGSAFALNENYRVQWLGHQGVQFLGAIPRSQLVKEQLSADIMAYPCSYQELFCIAAAECQIAGAYPVTSNAGALKTTNMGTVIPFHPDAPMFGEQFVTSIVDLLQCPEKLKQAQDEVRQKAKERFSIERILKEWDKVFA